MSNIRAIFRCGHSAAVTIPKMIAESAEIIPGSLVIFRNLGKGNIEISVLHVSKQKKEGKVENEGK